MYNDTVMHTIIGIGCVFSFTSSQYMQCIRITLFCLVDITGSRLKKTTFRIKHMQAFYSDVFNIFIQHSTTVIRVQEQQCNLESHDTKI